MHTIIDIRNDDNGRVVLEEAKRDRVNPFDLQCIYFEDLLSKYFQFTKFNCEELQTF